MQLGTFQDQQMSPEDRYAVKLGSGVVQVPNLYTVGLSTAVLSFAVQCMLLFIRVALIIRLG